jgi:hypothetical protein
MRFWPQVLTGLASVRDVLPEELSGSHSFEGINLILFLTTTQLYTDHSSQLGGRTVYNNFLTYFLLIHLLFFFVGWDLRHQVLRPLLAYCTAPDDR